MGLVLKLILGYILSGLTLVITIIKINPDPYQSCFVYEYCTDDRKFNLFVDLCFMFLIWPIVLSLFVFAYIADFIIGICYYFKPFYVSIMTWIMFYVSEYGIKIIV